MDWDSPNDPTLWRNVLLDAASYLEMNGWHPRGTADARRDGPADIVSAMAVVCVYSKPYTAALAELERSLAPLKISDWEAAPGRTQAEMIAKLRECAAR
jgi:membrane-bound lytic murein transglycosylase B